jgi:hypothetical protein
MYRLDIVGLPLHSVFNKEAYYQTQQFSVEHSTLIIHVSLVLDTDI